MSPQRRHHRDGVRRLLLAAANPERRHSEVADLLEGTDPGAVVRLARRHRVAALLHDRLRNLDGATAPALAAQLRHDHLEARARQLQAHATIAKLRSALAVPFLIIKGPALAQRWYQDPGLRTYVDIDVLVRHANFRAASEALLSAGFTHLLPSWEGLLAQGMAEVPMSYQASMVDLHWHLIARQDPRRAIELHEDAMFDRAQRLTLGAVDVATLDCEDTLLHLCIHSGLDGGRRLYQLVDVDRVMRSGAIDWDVFLLRACETGAQALCAAIIQRCRDLIGTPVPAGLLTDLTPYRGWLLANRLIDRHRRSDARLASGIASGMLMAAGRTRLRATVRSAVREAWCAASDRAPHLRFPRSPGPSPWRDDRDDAVSRERYLAWVDEQAPVRVR